ncbi:unnamed protein product, partial [Ixodes persulcatus]
PKASNPPRQEKPVAGRSAPPTCSRRRHQSHRATMVPRMCLRPPCLPRPKKWSLDLCPTTLWKRRVVAGRDPEAARTTEQQCLPQHSGLCDVIRNHFGTLNTRVVGRRVLGAIPPPPPPVSPRHRRPC